MGSIRSIYSGHEYQGFTIFDVGREQRKKVTGFYTQILDGVYQLAVEAIDSELVRPQALMLSFAFTDDYADHSISKVITRLKDKFRRVGKGRKKASTFRLRYLWVRETKYLTPRDPEYEESLTRDERRMYQAASDDGCPLPYPHYHLVLIIDGHKATWGAVRVVMQQLVNEKIVRPGFHFSENGQTKKKEMPLSSEAELQTYLYISAYVAKIDTKEVEEKRLWSMSSIKT